MNIRCETAVRLALVVCAAFGSASLSGAGSPSGFPFSDEVLNYSIVWPSGLTLGEAHLQASRSGEWNFDLKVDASLPGYAIRDHYSSTTSAALCTGSFQRDTIHGSKRASERITVSGDGNATRETVLGGKSELSVASCAHDALSFLFFVRQELGQGRMPAAQTVLFGRGYPARLDYVGRENVTVSNIPTDSDKVICTIQLPKSADYAIEMYFARDAARTPLVMRAPFAIGTFSVELQR
jgi:hypothetical protein